MYDGKKCLRDVENEEMHFKASVYNHKSEKLFSI